MNRKVILIIVGLVVMAYNTINYFFIVDNSLRWTIVMSSISFSQVMLIVLFLIQDWKKFALKKKSNIILSGWLFVYFLTDFTGTLLGYNLHSKGFAFIVFLILGIGFAHYLLRLWVHKH